MKPSILHVITTIDRGGAENHLLELARAQVKIGHKVAVAYLKGTGEQKENFRSAGIEVIQGGKSFFTQFAKIHRLARSGLFPIVHAHLPQAELACLGIPNHVISRHVTKRFVPSGPVFISKLAAKLSSHRCHVIAISEAVRDFLNENNELSKTAEINVVYYGINHKDFEIPNFDRVQWRQKHFLCDESTFVFGSISRLDPQKDLTTLIRAFAIVSKEIESKLFVMGVGPLRESLASLASELKLTGKIMFMGKRADTPEFLNSIDAFILTSKYEGLGLVLLEAMASGAPIIAANNSAIKEVVNKNVAILFTTSSVEELVASMRQMVRDDKERIERVVKGKRRVCENFGVDSMLEGTERVYSYMLARN